MRRGLRRSIGAAVLISLSSALAQGPAAVSEHGVLEGRLLRADGRPVQEGGAKLANKLKLFDAFSSGLFPARQFEIAPDAFVREVTIDSQGRFRFTEIPPGKYYLFWRVPGRFEGDDWFYRYHQPYNVGYVEGTMPEPDQHEIEGRQAARVADVEVIRRMDMSAPSPRADQPGVYEFRLPRIGTHGYFKVTISHQDYGPGVKHPAYGSHEFSGVSCLTPRGYPLHPGNHRFQIEAFTPGGRLYGKSEALQFTVPGEVLFLRVHADEADPSGRTVTWIAPDAIRSVKISSEDGQFTMMTDSRTIKLPPSLAARALRFRAFDERGKELIPGWVASYQQPGPKK